MDLEETFIWNEEAPTYAPSLPVPNVQEMVRKDSLQVQQRYVRDFADRPKDTDMSHLSSLIPVVDLSLLLKGNEQQLNKLDLLCQEWGFFQLVNHGVAEQVLQKMKDAAVEFFKLQLEEKNKYAMPSDDIQGYGQTYFVSEEQILDWQDVLMLIVHPSHYRKLEFWPKSPQGFTEIIEEYSNAIMKVAMELFPSLSAIMGMDKEALLGLHKQLVQGGLRVRITNSSQGRVVPVNPIPNALVVNVGDVVEMWSNGKYKSVEHRAVTNCSKARISQALFMAPHDDAEIQPLDHMLNSQSPQKLHKKVKYGEYLRNSMNSKMEGKAHTKIALVETFS